MVTARNTDIGELINAGSADGPPLFTVADVHQLRIYVQVPQTYSAEIQPGHDGELTVPEYPGRTFPRELVGTAGAIDAAVGHPAGPAADRQRRRRAEARRLRRRCSFDLPPSRPGRACRPAR